MRSIHDQLQSEIDSARKLVAEFASLPGGKSDPQASVSPRTDRLAQDEAMAAEIAALAAEEEHLTRLARERAEHRAKARAEEKARAGEIKALRSTLASEKAKSRWNAISILKGLAKLHAKERAAAEELIRKAGELNQDPGANPLPVCHHGSDRPADPIRAMWSPSLGAAQIWYFTSNGERCGPVTFSELRAMAASRILDPRLDMVWKKGMDGWKQAGLLDGLFERQTTILERPANPPKKPVALNFAPLPADLTGALSSKYICWPGIGRLGLWLGTLCFTLLWGQIISWTSPFLFSVFGSELMSVILPLATYLPIPVLVCLLLMRFSNLGMSRWWALALIAPVLNLWVAFRCLICPSGYAYHRKLDRSGWTIALVVAIVVPFTLYLSLKYPDLLSFGKLQTGLRSVIQEAGRAFFLR